MISNFHQFHIVSISPWPLLASISAGILVINIALSIGNINMVTITKTIIVIILTSIIWWSDTINESNNEGEHQSAVSNGLNIGIVLFITSEVIFFFSFFWCYFHSGISPATEIGQIWPPNIINSFNPANVPLLNTLILISSGVSVTWAHHNVIKNNNINGLNGLSITCILGAYFSYLQYLEYSQAEFIMSDSSYGSIFFIATGFHGIHVIIGTLFLTVSAIIVKSISISNGHHNSFEIAAWYWHFVDVVWLVLYLSIYWWGK